jgi:hypothetical protein
MENSRRKFGNLNYLTWLWQWILRLTIGYGYRPWYALLWSIGVVAFGWVLFWSGYRAGAITPTDKDAYARFENYYCPADNHGEPPPYYPRFSSLVYAVDTFLPIITFGQKDHWTPNSSAGADGAWLRRYLWMHIGLGWLLTTLFVAGLTPIVRSG